MSKDLSKIIAMASGENRKDFIENNISEEIRIKIDDALDKIFLGKSLLLWADGGKLVDAWNTALDNLRDEMFAIPATTDIIQYLRTAVFNHRAKWTTKMTTSDERNTVANLGNDDRNDLVEHAKTMIEMGGNTIKQIIQLNQSGVQHTQTTIKPQQVMMHQSIEHGHENSMEHERIRKR